MTPVRDSQLPAGPVTLSQEDVELIELIRTTINEATAEAIKAHMSDPNFWRAGLAHMAEHATDVSSRWIGRRILVAIVAAVATTSLIWLAKTGTLK